MPPAIPDERRTRERRHLVDRRSRVTRRSGRDRRQTQRRARAVAVHAERRSGHERRERQRRRIPDRREAALRRSARRRRETPTPYTVDELARVRHMFATPGARAACPSCGGAFTLGRSRPRGAEMIRQIRCLSCGKTAVVTNSRLGRVLVVEVNDVVRDTVRTILAGAGHEVIEAADGSVGLEAYRANPADVVLINVLAAGRMDAGEFIRRLRRDYPDARVVAMSGRPSYGVADPLAVAKQLGATRTIRMPFSRDELLKAVEEIPA